MNIPVWTKPALYGAVVGGLVVAIVGFTWGGWVTGDTAQRSAVAAADQTRSDLVAAICVQNFLAADDAREQLSDLQAINTSAQQRRFVEQGGWAVVPDGSAVSTQATTLCSRMLVALEPEELPVVDDGEVVEEGEVIEPTDEEVAPDATPAPEAPVSEDDTVDAPEVTTP